MSVDAAFGALAHPLRRQMLVALTDAPRTISELAAGAAITFAAVSKHLRVLEEAGLVRRRVEGRSHYFAASPGALRPAADWVAAHSALWQEGLFRLKTMMETEMENELAARAEVFVAAPPERVFDAWCEPSRAARFLGVGDPSRATVELDARVGGALFVAMRFGEVEILHRGEFLVLDRPRRLVMTWMSQPTGLRLTIVSVDFVPERDGTRVRLVHEGFTDAKTARQHAGGWGGILESLAALPG